jgi:hypothetical protein
MKRLILIILVLFPVVGFSLEMKCEAKRVKEGIVDTVFLRCENKEVILL